MSSKMAPNLNETFEENREKQAEMRNYQLEKDDGKTVEVEQRDPCKHERNALNKCTEYKRTNGFITCHDYEQNLKTCGEFWNAVQDYREKVLHLNTYQLPTDEIMAKWRKQMPDFIINNNTLVPPDNPQ